MASVKENLNEKKVDQLLKNAFALRKEAERAARVLFSHPGYVSMEATAAKQWGEIVEADDSRAPRGFADLMHKHLRAVQYHPCVAGSDGRIKGMDINAEKIYSLRTYMYKGYKVAHVVRDDADSYGWCYVRDPKGNITDRDIALCEVSYAELREHEWPAKAFDTVDQGENSFPDLPGDDLRPLDEEFL